MKWLVFLMCVLPSFSLAETWVSVGADTEARYYVDTDSIQMEGENTIVMKKGAYTQTLTDKLDDGKPVVFKATIARLEIDCERGLNRVTQMDMVSEEGDNQCARSCSYNFRFGVWSDALGTKRPVWPFCHSASY